MIKMLEDTHTPERVNIAVQSLVRKGVLEQFVDEYGNFQFQMTELGTSIAEEVMEDPTLFFDLDDIDDIDDEVDE